MEWKRMKRRVGEWKRRCPTIEEDEGMKTDFGWVVACGALNCGIGELSLKK
jgi:hypothetical protein